MAETKKFSLTLKSLSETGQFEGLASVYGNVDLGGDIVEAGAFTKTLKERGSEVPILWQHEPGSSVGLGRLEDTSKGLVIRGQLEMDLPEAKSAYIRLKKGLVRGLSIGFKAVKDHIENGIRHITEAKLYEVSLVTFPMNEMAQVTTVKAASQLTFEQKKLFLKQLARAVELDLFATQLEWRFSRVLDDLQEHLLYQLRSL